jgi:hypothetical protein
MIEQWVGTNWHLVEATQVGPIFDSIGLWFPTGYLQRKGALVSSSEPSTYAGRFGMSARDASEADLEVAR